MDMQDFMKIMITELTNQDPFEPIKNQDLLAQMSGIQQIQASQEMTETFTGISNNFNSLLEHLNTFLGREQISIASGAVGQTVLGVNEAGQTIAGRVQAVTIEGQDVYLELDTGDRIHFNDIDRLGGATGQDVLGTFVVGTDAGGNSIAGVVDSIETNGSDITLRLTSGHTLALNRTTVITPDTVYVLLGRFVQGDGKQGTVNSYRMTGPNISDISLQLDTGQELAITDVESIRTNQAQ